MWRALSLTALVGYLVLLVNPSESYEGKSTSTSRFIPRGGSSYPDSFFGSETPFPQDQESVQDRVNAWKQNQMVGERKHSIPTESFVSLCRGETWIKPTCVCVSVFVSIGPYDTIDKSGLRKPNEGEPFFLGKPILITLILTIPYYCSANLWPTFGGRRR